MPRQTLAGWRISSDRQPGLSDGITSPAICVVMEVASRSIPAAKVALKSHKGGPSPPSRP